MLCICLIASFGISAAFNVDESGQQSDLNSVFGSNNNTNTTTPGRTCADYNVCGNCSGEWNCVWCETDSKCLDGSIYGPNENPFTGCGEWRWRQCSVNGKAIFWSAVAIIVALFLLCLFMCFCYCCFCRKRRKHSHQKTWSQIKAEEAEMDGLLNASKTPKTDSRREQIYSKYGRPEERNRNSYRP